MQGPSLSQCFKKVPDVAASPRATPPPPPPPPHPDRRIPATCCGDKPIRRGRMKRGEEQPLGGARADISRALFPSGPGAGFGCRVLWSSVRHREPLSVALRLHTLDPSPTASDRAGAQAEWGGGGERSQGARERRPNRPFPAPTGAHARPALQCETLHLVRGAGGMGYRERFLAAPILPSAQATDHETVSLGLSGLVLTMFPETKGR